jgi:sortase (surface protein transpeptidase)
MRWYGLTLAGLVLVAGCGYQGVPAAEAPPVNGDPIASATAAPVGAPTSIAISKLGVVDDIVPVALDQATGVMEVPAVDQTGWWSQAVQPGEIGVAVVLSHVNYKGVDGAFARLSELRKGDELTVTDANGVKRRFVVTERRTFKKDAFTEQHDLLFDDHGTPDLVAVTCGGTLVGSSYDSNVAVRATEVP